MMSAWIGPEGLAVSHAVHPAGCAWRPLAQVVGEGESGRADVFAAVAGLDG